MKIKINTNNKIQNYKIKQIIKYKNKKNHKILKYRIPQIHFHQTFHFKHQKEQSLLNLDNLLDYMCNCSFPKWAVNAL